MAGFCKRRCCTSQHRSDVRRGCRKETARRPGMSASRGSWRSDWNMAVGYKKPPKHSQFQPGRSGNPKGRRRKQKGPRQLLEDALNEAATVTENGKSKVLSKKQIVFKVLVASAIKGNSKAMSAVFKLMNDYGIADELEPSVNEMMIKLVRAG